MAFCRVTLDVTTFFFLHFLELHFVDKGTVYNLYVQFCDFQTQLEITAGGVNTHVDLLSVPASCSMHMQLFLLEYQGYTFKWIL